MAPVAIARWACSQIHKSLELVRRVPSPDDRRAFLIESRVGAKKRAQLDAVIEDGDRTCFSVLSAAERKELLRLLDKCIAHLDDGT